MRINVPSYLEVVGRDREVGGQELISDEIVALCGKAVWLPYPTTGLQLALQASGRETVLDLSSACDTVYFGTPTIVNDAPLFARGVPVYIGFGRRPVWCPKEWTKETERLAVRALRTEADVHGLRIVCGLGSGDISVDERLADIGGGNVAAYKAFVDDEGDEFEDWVIAKEAAE